MYFLSQQLGKAFGSTKQLPIGLSKMVFGIFSIELFTIKGKAPFIILLFGILYCNCPYQLPLQVAFDQALSRPDLLKLIRPLNVPNQLTLRTVVAY